MADDLGMLLIQVEEAMRRRGWQVHDLDNDRPVSHKQLADATREVLDEIPVAVRLERAVPA